MEKQESVSVSAIVELLLREPLLLQNVRKFSDSLEIPYHQYSQWIQSYRNQQLDAYELYHNLLSSWMSRRKSKFYISTLRNVLESDDFIQASEWLQDEFGDNAVISAPVINKLAGTKPLKIKSPPFPLPHSNAVIRKEIMETAMEGLLSKADKHSPITFPIVVLHGFGGFGKSELAKLIAVELKIKGEFNQILWFDVDKDPIEQQLSTVLQLNDYQPPCEPNNIELLKQKFYYLIGKASSLLIFDNVTDFNTLMKFLPLNENRKRISILITSRTSWNPTSLEKVLNIPISQLSYEEAHLLAQNYNIVSDKEKLGIIAASDRIPLVLTIMCSSVRWHKKNNPAYSVASYIERCQDITNPPRELLFYDGNQNGDMLEIKYSNSLLNCMNNVVSSLNLSGTAVGELAVLLLDRIIYCSSETYSDILIRLGTKIHNLNLKAVEICDTSSVEVELKEAVNAAVAELDRFGIVTKYQDESTGQYRLRIHKLLQTARKFQLQAEGKEPMILSQLIEYYRKRDIYLTEIWSCAVNYPQLIRKYLAFLPTTLFRGDEHLDKLEKILDALETSQVEQYILKPGSFEHTEFCYALTHGGSTSIAKLFCNKLRAINMDLDKQAEFRNAISMQLLEALISAADDRNMGIFESLYVLFCSILSIVGPSKSHVKMSVSKRGGAGVMEILLRNEENIGKLPFSFKVFTSILKDIAIEKLQMYLGNNQDDINKMSYGETLLHLALHHDANKACIELLLGLGADAKIKDGVEMRTSLHIAAQYSRSSIIKIIAMGNPDLLDSRSEGGLTPLFCAMKCEDEEQSISNLKCLLDLGANYQSMDDNGRTLFHFVTYNDSFECLKFLLEYITETGIIEKPDKDGCTVLHNLLSTYYSFNHVHTDVVSLLLEKSPRLLTIKDDNEQLPIDLLGPGSGRTKSMYQIFFTEAWKALDLVVPRITEGIKLNSSDALCQHCKALIQIIVLHDGGIQALKKLFDTRKVLTKIPFSFAVLEFLIKHPQGNKLYTEKIERDIHEKDEFQRTILQFGIKNKWSIDKVNIALKKGVDIKAQDIDGQNTLHYAVIFGTTATTRLIFKTDPTLARQKNQLGMTPLHCTVASDYESMLNRKDKLNCLANNGSDIESTDCNQCNVLQTAVKYGNLDAVEILLSLGTKITIFENQDTEGNTVLHHLVSQHSYSFPDTSNLYTIAKTIYKKCPRALKLENQQGLSPFEILQYNLENDDYPNDDLYKDFQKFESYLKHMVNSRFDLLRKTYQAANTRKLRIFQPMYERFCAEFMVKEQIDTLQDAVIQNGGDETMKLLFSNPILRAHIPFSLKTLVLMMDFKAVKFASELMEDEFNINGNVLLQFKIRKGTCKPMVQFLMERGADPGKVDENGWNSLHHAAVFGNLETVEAIVERRPDLLESKDKWDFTALHNATKLVKVTKRLQKLDYLLGQGAKFDTVNKSKRNLLQSVVIIGDYEALEILLSWIHDMDVIEHQDTNGDTALHYLVNMPHYGNPQDVLLLAEGLLSKSLRLLTIKNNKALTPFQQLVENLREIVYLDKDEDRFVELQSLLFDYMDSCNESVGLKPR